MNSINICAHLVSVKYDKADPEGRFFKFSVIDTGKGIAEEDLPLVFKKYWQKGFEPGKGNDVVGVLGNGGAGLGLSICKMLVEVDFRHVLFLPRPKLTSLPKGDGRNHRCGFHQGPRKERVHLLV